MHKKYFLLQSLGNLDTIHNNKVTIKDDESDILNIGNKKSGNNIQNQTSTELNGLSRKDINNFDISITDIDKEYDKYLVDDSYNINTKTNDDINNNKLNLTIKLFSNHGYKYLQLIHTFYVIENGKKVRKCRVIENLGMLSKFDDGQPLFLERLRLSFKNNTPIIKELEKYVNPEAAKPCQPGQSDFFRTGVLKAQELTSWKSKNIGYFLLESIYNELGINNVLSLYKYRYDLNYDINGIFKLLLIGRCLNPDSKLGTYDDKDRYLFDITTTENVYDVYNSLTIYDEKNITIQLKINNSIASTIGRDTETCFYDVSNFFFEIKNNDNDYKDKDNNTVSGLRKRGMSKENRREPIVQVGLFMDNNGLPISYRIYPGNYNDQLTLRPIFAETISKMNFGRIIVVSDGGVNSGANIAYLLDNGHGYIFPRSLKKSENSIKEWVYDISDYIYNDKKTFKTKSQIITRTITDVNGNKRVVTEKIISYWSEKLYKKDLRDLEETIKKCQSIVSNPTLLTSKDKYIKQFLNEINIDTKTGEKLDIVKIYEINMTRIEEYKKSLGYYTLFTSEISLDDMNIYNKYHALSRIEDSFRVMKSTLESRPIFVRTPEHINAHFLVCFCSLLVIRIIQYRILKYQKKETRNINGWESGLSAKRIRNAISEWMAIPNSTGKYVINSPSEDLQLIFDAFGVKLEIKDNTLSVAEIKKLNNAIAKVKKLM